MIWAIPLTISLTIFLSAFLLFQVEPMTVKYLLPWFGGGAAVWSDDKTSLLPILRWWRN
jgi:hypothetical protein